MRLTVGGVERRARVTDTFRANITQVNFAYTVTADDFDADGIAIPANSIVAGSWAASGGNTVDRNHRALSSQSAHKVVGSAASISATSPASLTEATLNTATVSVALTGAAFGSGVLSSHFELVTTIPGLTVSQVSGASSGSAAATLTLSFTGDFSVPATLAVRVKGAAHTGARDLTTATVAVAPTDERPTLPVIADFYVQRGAAMTPLQLPAATGGNGALDYILIGGPPEGTKFDLTGSDTNGCTAADFPAGYTDTADLAAAPRVFCGTPTAGDNWAFQLVAHDADANRASRDSARRPFIMFTYGASVSATSPSALTEANLNGAAVTVSLEDTTFGSGVTKSSFALVTTIPGVSIDRIATVSPGATTATLTLAFTGDWRGAGRPLAVKVLAAAHRQAGDLTTAAVTVPPVPGLTLAPATSATSRLRTTEAGDTATFTVRLDRAPSGNVVLDVTSSDTGEGTAMPARLTFTPSAWNTAQTVTVTGVDDVDDDGTETWQVRLDPSSDDTNYNSLAVIVEVDVTTTDDDGPPTVTLALNPASLAESGTGSTATVSATLSHPSGAATTVTVAAVSGLYTAGSDAAIVIAAGATTAADTATVVAVDNDTDAPDRVGTVTATVTNARAAADSTTMAVTGAALTVRDDDAAPTAALALAPASISENGGLSTVTATLSHPSSQPSTVTVAAAAVAPAVGGDFSLGTATTLTVAAGSTTSAGTVTVAAVDNAVDNAVDAADKEVTVSATAAGGRGLANPADATLTLRDDEATADVNGDGAVNANDGLLMYYAYTFEAVFKLENDLGRRVRGFLRTLRGPTSSHPADDAGYKAMLNAAWGLRSPSS